MTKRECAHKMFELFVEGNDCLSIEDSNRAYDILLEKFAEAAIECRSMAISGLARELNSRN